jgi:hypothetical protein
LDDGGSSLSGKNSLSDFGGDNLSFSHGLDDFVDIELLSFSLDDGLDLNDLFGLVNFVDNSGLLNSLDDSGGLSNVDHR